MRGSTGFMAALPRSCEYRGPHTLIHSAMFFVRGREQGHASGARHFGQRWPDTCRIEASLVEGVFAPEDLEAPRRPGLDTPDRHNPGTITIPKCAIGGNMWLSPQSRVKRRLNEGRAHRPPAASRQAAEAVDQA